MRSLRNTCKQCAVSHIFNISGINVYFICAVRGRFLKKEVMWEPNCGVPGYANGVTATAPNSSAEVARIWAPKAPKEVGCGEGSGEALSVPPEKIFDLDLK